MCVCLSVWLRVRTRIKDASRQRFSNKSVQESLCVHSSNSSNYEIAPHLCVYVFASMCVYVSVCRYIRASMCVCEFTHVRDATRQRVGKSL